MLVAVVLVVAFVFLLYFLLSPLSCSSPPGADSGRDALAVNHDLRMDWSWRSPGSDVACAT